MSFDPPPLPPQGFLLAKLGYVEEAVAAIAIDVSTQTMIEYRKKGSGRITRLSAGRSCITPPG